MDLRLHRWPGRLTPRAVVGLVLTAALLVAYMVVAIVEDVPQASQGRSWSGQGFLFLSTIGIVGLASLVAAVRAGRARRSASRQPDAEQVAPRGGDDQRP